MTTATRQPAHPIQRGMWLASQLDPISSEFTVSTAVRLTGPLDRSALRAALGDVLAGQPLLRSRFARYGHNGLSLVADPDLAAPLAETDLGALSATAAEDTARERVAAAARVPFDLENGPLLRGMLVRLGPEDHVVALHLHHAVCDGDSVQILYDAWSRAYANRTGAGPSPGTQPAPRPFPHDDTPEYFRHATVSEKEHAEGLAYWSRRLDGAQPLALPLTGTPGRTDRDGAGHRFALSAPLVRRVDAYAREAHTTRYAVLLTAYAALLARLCRTEEVTIGTTASTRLTEEARPAVGPLFNTLALRSGVRADLTFRDATDTVTDTVLDAFEHVRVPFEDVLDIVRTAASSGLRNPLFNVFFELDHDTAPALRLPGCAATAFPFPDHAPKTDLMLVLRPDAEGLTGEFTYRTAVCDATGVRALAEGFTALLDRALATPETPLTDLPVMPEHRRAEVLERFAEGGSAPFEDRCVHRLFEEQVRRTPEAVAVRELGGATRTLTYGELNGRANRLARYLVDHGVAAHDRVALLLRRSPDLVVACLAVWKAGAAYVPLDPTFPDPRLAFVVEDTDARLVVTESSLAGRAASLGGDVVALDEAWPAIAVHAESDLPGGPDAGALAYVIHTSGSTGRPKGVLVEHRGLANFLAWCVSRYAAEGDGGAPLFSSMAFDMVVPDLYTPLLTGQSVALAPDGLPPDRLGEVLAGGAPYSFIKLTPGHLKLLTAQLTPAQARGLARLLVVGADAFPPAALAAWRALAPDVPLLNEYGPTEATVANSAYEIPPPAAPGAREADAPATLPIGRPIPNTTLYVLDGDGAPVPPGVVGEIHIGGACVARGYANRPAATAERFLDDPYGPPGARLYRTGDLGRWLPDGQAEFLGRSDHQVKISGYRVEPGEVEAALVAAPGVCQALVVTADTPAGAPALVAHVVPDPGSAFDAAALRAELVRTLPAHLVPARVLELATIPLNANGKVDRAALPEPEWGGGATGGPRGPRTPAEEAVTRAWAEVLGLAPDAFGPDDNFFGLGGNSLLVLTVVARLRGLLGAQFTFARFLQDPTVAGIAAALGETAQPPGGGRSLAPLALDGDGVPTVFVHPLGGTVFCYRHIVEILRGEGPLYGLTLGALRGEEPDGDDRLEDTAARYAAEILDTVSGPVNVVGWSAGGVTAFETARQLRALGGDVAHLVLLDPSTPHENTRWRGYVRQLRRIRTKLGLADDEEREAEFQAVLRGDLFQAMGIDPATCRDYSLFPQDVLLIWQRQLETLGGYEVGFYDGPMTVLTSQEKDGDDQILLVAQWQEHAGGPVKHIQVGGDHLQMMQLPAAASSAAALAELITRGGRSRDDHAH
ncbi:non-ribosomal peptide synthetase [Streptomyces alfalfae]|uniref:non-ribosomal peptide synthetase n=1 Tax=Streptomyces alfalfae TaxID=1642299 RepID=UPI001BAC21CC|nr:non-ribosomal peptide synthetase [Streptomyces alfalfae]QUI35310.1 amino acid adenylation domain-containing protein [Streptomyces alfalfae]